MNYPHYVEIDKVRYPINTSYKVAIECDQIARDETIGNYERALAIIYKLFGRNALNDKKNHERLLELAQKYLCCGEELTESNKTQIPDMDYIEDMKYIKASFRSDYGIDLNKEDMHWYEFSELMNGLSNSELGSCCILNKIRNIRNMNLNEIKDSKIRKQYEDSKKQFALKRNKVVKKFTDEQLENMRKFEEQMNERS